MSDTTTDDVSDDNGDNEPDDAPTGLTLTQQQLNAKMAREKKEGKKAALKELVDELGVESIEDIKNFFTEAKDKTGKDEEDAQKRLKRAEDRERKAAEREQAAIRRINETNVLAELIATGLDKKAAGLLVKSVNVNLLDEDLDTDDIGAAVSELQETLPQLFTPAAPVPDEPPPVNRPTRTDTTTTTRDRRPTSPRSPQDIALDLVKQRHPRAMRNKDLTAP
jgi:hypothetical protein